MLSGVIIIPSLWLTTTEKAAGIEARLEEEKASVPVLPLGNFVDREDGGQEEKPGVLLAL